MGMYIYVTKEDRVTKRQVENPGLNNLFQEALKYCPSLMIDTCRRRIKVKTFLFFYKYQIEERYSVYHETPAYDGSPYQAIYQMSACGSIDTVVTYLHGIINGATNDLSTLNLPDGEEVVKLLEWVANECFLHDDETVEPYYSFRGEKYTPQQIVQLYKQHKQ